MNKRNDRENLSMRIRMLLAEKTETVVIAIDGMSGSGKSTLAEELHREFPDSNVFHTDDYFLRPQQRTKKRLEEIGGNVDYERFKLEILEHIHDRDGLTFSRYDCRTQTMGTPVFVAWRPLAIIEGSYSQHPYFGEMYDLRVFCEVSEEEQRARILKRNGEERLVRFLEEWIPKENAYFRKYKIKERKDC